MYATTTSGHREHVTVQKSSKVLQAMSINSTYCRLIQTSTVTTEEWYGLSYTDASGVCVASETSVLGGTTRNYLGGAKITVASGGVSQWATIEGYWGTRISSQMQRMSDTNLYHVTKTTEELDVSNNGGTMQKL